MRFDHFNRKFGRMAVAFTTVIALTLPVNSTASINPDRAGVPGKRQTMDLTLQSRQNVRLDGVAASLMTRPTETLVSAERRELVDRYCDQIIALHTDLEAFARSAEFAAALSAGNVDEFVMAISFLTLDATDNWTAVVAGPLTRLRQRIHNRIPWFPAGEALLRYGSQGFAVDDKSNQAQHFWYSVAITYKWGERLAETAARYHEWNPPPFLRWLPGTGNGNGSEGDLHLSHQGMALGRMLRDGSVRPEGVGQWLREHLK